MMASSKPSKQGSRAACRGIYFGVIYGGIIYPPNGAQYYPPAIVAVVVFGPVFAQSWFFGPTGVIVWSVTIFYRPGGVRIWNPGKCSERLDMAQALAIELLGVFGTGRSAPVAFCRSAYELGGRAATPLCWQMRCIGSCAVHQPNACKDATITLLQHRASDEVFVAVACVTAAMTEWTRAASVAASLTILWLCVQLGTTAPSTTQQASSWEPSATARPGSPATQSSPRCSLKSSHRFAAVLWLAWGWQRVFECFSYAVCDACQICRKDYG